MSYVVISDRDKVRMYLGEDNAWWRDPEKAKYFASQRLALHAQWRSDVATGYQKLSPKT